MGIEMAGYLFFGILMVAMIGLKAIIFGGKDEDTHS